MLSVVQPQCRSLPLRVLPGVRAMAKSKYEYVRHFEADDSLLRNTWIVVRIDGRGFSQFTNAHAFAKPNDERGIALMTTAARAVCAELGDIVLAYTQSDECSFVFERGTTLYGRRASKIVTAVVSLFTSNYVYRWSECFPTQRLLHPPSFDGRAVCYPSPENLRDYLSWRQADCHINNLYNTCFWALVHGGQTSAEAEAALRGTVSSDKNELLFSRFNINYAHLPEVFRKGTIIMREDLAADGKPEAEPKQGRQPNAFHIDLIGDEFWTKRPWLLNRR